MKRLTTKWFKKWSKKVKVSNQNLLDAINDLEAGLSTVDLGNHLFKVRVKREHSGKSSGYRTIIVFKAEDMAIFLFGFGKNEKENINKNELQYFWYVSNKHQAYKLRMSMPPAVKSENRVCGKPSPNRELINSFALV